ncbi:hypothetical protein [Nostoc sp. C117]|uniref:hypothetical protein n=1 Tax=Nostoc sp. C117 TaxID=3349875 RepID=UPI00370D341E
MEELLTLKDLLVKGDVQGALIIVEELTEMSRNDNAVILLLHLIKQQAENRTTCSWEVSIRNSVREIQRENKRGKAGSYYLTPEELLEILGEAYLNAIDEASLEVEEGRYEAQELEKLVNREQIINRALTLILPGESN